MRSELALPTRADEDFRYADLNGLAQLWPVPVEEWTVSRGTSEAKTIALTTPSDIVREISIDLAAGAALDLRLLIAGPSYARVALRVTLGKGARFHLGAAQLAGGLETLEIVTHVDHAEPDASSSQLIRSIAGGKGTVSYLGKVHVARGADGTDGAQSVRAMLLDRTATANARPELEIYADDVKCAHGCAVGELDAAALFYLQSRGLPPAEAKRIMLGAFVAEAFSGAADEAALTEATLAALQALL